MEATEELCPGLPSGMFQRPQCSLGPSGCHPTGLIGKDSDAGRDWGQEEKGTTEDEMAGWHH